MAVQFWETYQKQWWEWQQKGFDLWLKSFSVGKLPFSWLDNFETSLSHNKSLINSSLELQHKTLQLIGETQKRLWHNYFDIPNQEEKTLEEK